MTHWLTQISRLFETSTPFVIATIWSIDGASPDTEGDRLVITASSCTGQLRSTRRHTEIIHHARTMLSQSTPNWQEKTYALGEIAGQHNGHCTIVFEQFMSTGGSPDWVHGLNQSLSNGETTVLANRVDFINSTIRSVHEVKPTLVETLKDKKPQAEVVVHNSQSKTFLQLITGPKVSIAVVGTSPVAKALVQQCALLPLEIHWITKKSPASVSAPNLRFIEFNDNAITRLPPGTRIAIATNNHLMDIHCSYLALKNPGITYIGCLGSQKKAHIVRMRLTELGINENRLASLRIPVGLQTISGKHPAVIAASIVAQLLENH